MKQIAVRVDDDLLAAIEKARGDVPRERWLRTVLRRETGRAISNARAIEAEAAAPPGTTSQGRQSAPAIDRNTLAMERMRKSVYKGSGK